MTDVGRFERLKLWAWRALPPLVAGVLLWLVAAPACVVRHLELPDSSDLGPPRALEWRRAGTQMYNGVWVRSLPVRERLPAYAIDDLRLRAPTGTAPESLGRPLAVVRLLGATVATREGVVRPASSTEGDGVSTKPLDPPVVGHLDVDVQAPWWVHAVGVAGAAAACGLAWAALACVSGGWAWLQRQRWKWRALVAGVVIGVHFWAAVATPMVLTGDALGYLVHSTRFAQSGWPGDAGLSKSPLFSMLLAIPMVFGGDPLDWARVALVLSGLGCTLLVFATLRRLTSEAAALVGALLCGLNPLLITMEAYLLRETLGGCVVAGLALLFTYSPRKRPLAFGVLAGVIGGLGALLRENFQSLIVLLPLAMLVLPGWGGPTPISRGAAWRTRLLAAAGSFVISLGCVAPWYAIQYERFDRASMTLPKLNLNKALNSWSNGVLDLNQTALASPTTAHDLARRNFRQRLSDYGAVYGILDATDPDTPPLVRGRPKPSQVILSYREAVDRTAWIEQVTGVMVDESQARSPASVWKGRAVALLSLTGLGIFPDHPSAASLEWFSRPLRKIPQGISTNLQFSSAVIPDYKPEWVDLEPYLRTHEAVLPHDTSRTFGRWFNCLFLTNELLRPPLAVLAIVAGVAAWRRRSWPILALALVIAGNLIGAAYVVATAADRVGVPFIPGLIVMAMWVMWTWWGASATFRQQEPADRAGGSPELAGKPGLAAAVTCAV